VRPLHSCLDDGPVVLGHLAADPVEAFEDCGDGSRSATEERVKHGSAWRRDHLDEVAHEGEGLDGGMASL